MALVELAIPARSAYLSLVRLVVDASVLALGPRLGGARLDDLKVAVTEACSNAIDAHRTAWGDGPVRIRCDLRPEAASVEIVDQGAGFDPDDLTTLPAATDPRRLRHESGLGIPLMRTLADDVSFSPVPGGTSVRLTVQTEAGRRRTECQVAAAPSTNGQSPGPSPGVPRRAAARMTRSDTAADTRNHATASGGDPAHDDRRTPSHQPASAHMSPPHGTDTGQRDRPSA